MRHAAHTDAKTGLLNVAAWTEHANGMLSRNARHGRSVAVMVIDIAISNPNSGRAKLCTADRTASHQDQTQPASTTR